MYYNLNDRRKKTILHVMNVSTIYEKCKSCELITSFNGAGLCVSYKKIKKHRNNLSKLAILFSSQMEPQYQIILCLMSLPWKH